VIYTQLLPIMLSIISLLLSIRHIYDLIDPNEQPTESLHHQSETSTNGKVLLLLYFISLCKMVDIILTYLTSYCNGLF